MGQDEARARGPTPDGAAAAVVDRVEAWVPADRACVPRAGAASHTSRGCPASKSDARNAARPSSVRVQPITRRSANVAPKPPAISRGDEDAWRRRFGADGSRTDNGLGSRHLRRNRSPRPSCRTWRGWWRMGPAKPLPGHRRGRMDAWATGPTGVCRRRADNRRGASMALAASRRARGRTTADHRSP